MLCSSHIAHLAKRQHAQRETFRSQTWVYIFSEERQSRGAIALRHRTLSALEAARRASQHSVHFQGLALFDVGSVVFVGTGRGVVRLRKCAGLGSPSRRIRRALWGHLLNAKLLHGRDERCPHWGFDAIFRRSTKRNDLFREHTLRMLFCDDVSIACTEKSHAAAHGDEEHEAL